MVKYKVTKINDLNWKGYNNTNYSINYLAINDLCFR
jgi:hypothetical protein